MKIAAYGQIVHPDNAFLYFQFFDEMEKRNLEVFVENNFYKILLENFPLINRYKVVVFSELNEKVDFFFTFGGDGTILSAVTFIKDTEIPIVGINTGRLGFLASTQKKDFSCFLEDFFKGNYLLSERALLSVNISGNYNEEFPYALNEVVAIRKETTAMIMIDAYVDGKFLNTFWADGLIISTPTGSTGYSLSCGGPIISPQNTDFVITPISPHNLNVRPIIVEDNTEIQLIVNSRVPEYLLTLDSRLKTLSTQDKILIKKAPFKVKMLHRKDYSYFQILREKLLWGEDSRN